MTSPASLPFESLLNAVLGNLEEVSVFRSSEVVTAALLDRKPAIHTTTTENFTHLCEGNETQEEDKLKDLVNHLSELGDILAKSHCYSFVNNAHPKSQLSILKIGEEGYTGKPFLSAWGREVAPPSVEGMLIEAAQHFIPKLKEKFQQEADPFGTFFNWIFDAHQRNATGFNDLSEF